MLVLEYNIVYNNYKLRDRSQDAVTEFTFETEEQQIDFLRHYIRNRVAATYAYAQVYGEINYA